MVHAALLMPILPLTGFVSLALFGKRLGDPLAGWIGTLSVFGSFVAASVTYAGLLEGDAGARRAFVQSWFVWVPAGHLHVSAALLIDPLSMTMALFVTSVSALIHLYSIGYMKGDSDYPKFFVYMNLFVTSMLFLVLANNLLFTFVGWEGVGVCSYWLIAFWFEEDKPASAGQKAFVYTRLADMGFLVAMFFVFASTGTLDFTGIFSHIPSISTGARTAIVLLFFASACGKSAQLPLFPWLADAMEGPTPVSALIHAATMVTAGVYLMCRLSHLLALSHPAQLVVASVGAATALIAAIIGCGQQDIKKVLAYSTVSQLGYMFLAVGTGAYVAAIFLMVAHAFFKGLLFLGAGSVIHGLGNEQDLKRMGSLRRYMKLTFFTFAAGWLAIAGIPPLSGFWAKGDILINAYARFPALWAIGLLTAVFTAYYMSRLTALAFYGVDRWPSRESDVQHPPHEGPWVMALPLVVLAVLAFSGGVLSLPWHPPWDPLRWLEPVFGNNLYSPVQSAGTKWALSIADALAAIVGLAVALPLWSRRAERPALEPPALRRALYLDDVYDTTLGRPSTALARLSAVVIDPKIIDGVVNGIAGLVRGSASGLRRLQTGFLRQYLLAFTLGIVALLAWMAMRALS